MLTTLINIVHVFVCLFLMLVVLLQQGKGGGMGAAFGGGAAQQVFGGRGAGNILTKATAICAGIFMLTSVTLAYLSSSGDRALRAKVASEQHKGKGTEGAPRKKDEKPKEPEKPSDKPQDQAPGAAPSGAPAAPAPTGSTPQ